MAFDGIFPIASRQSPMPDSAGCARTVGLPRNSGCQSVTWKISPRIGSTARVSRRIASVPRLKAAV